jgi:hypothetical protein
MLYSYRNASIGSSCEAFIAGYNPETKPTKKLVAKAAKMACHGVTNAKLRRDEIP